MQEMESGPEQQLGCGAMQSRHKLAKMFRVQNSRKYA